MKLNVKPKIIFILTKIANTFKQLNRPSIHKLINSWHASSLLLLIHLLTHSQVVSIIDQLNFQVIHQLLIHSFIESFIH